MEFKQTTQKSFSGWNTKQDEVQPLNKFPFENNFRYDNKSSKDRCKKKENLFKRGGMQGRKN